MNRSHHVPAKELIAKSASADQLFSQMIDLTATESSAARHVFIISATPVLAVGLRTVILAEYQERVVAIIHPSSLLGPNRDQILKRLNEKCAGATWIVHCRYVDGFDPFSFTKDLKTLICPLSVILLLDCLGDLYVSLAHSCEANVVLHRDDSVDTISQAFHAAMLNAVFRSSAFEVARDNIRQQDKSIAGHGLSDREIATAVSIATGRSISEISYDWGLSRKTISTYRKRALAKLSLKSDAELVRFLLERYPYLLNESYLDSCHEVQCIKCR